jgi:hypothetical protein
MEHLCNYHRLVVMYVLRSKSNILISTLFSPYIFSLLCKNEVSFSYKTMKVLLYILNLEDYEFDDRKHFAYVITGTLLLLVIRKKESRKR